MSAVRITLIQNPANDQYNVEPYSSTSQQLLQPEGPWVSLRMACTPSRSRNCNPWEASVPIHPGFMVFKHASRKLHEAGYDHNKIHKSLIYIYIHSQNDFDIYYIYIYTVQYQNVSCAPYPLQDVLIFGDVCGLGHASQRSQKTNLATEHLEEQKHVKPKPQRWNVHFNAMKPSKVAPREMIS